MRMQYQLVYARPSFMAKLLRGAKQYAVGYNWRTVDDKGVVLTDKPVNFDGKQWSYGPWKDYTEFNGDLPL